MAIRAKSIVVTVTAIIESTAAPKTGDAANITIKVIKDGTAGTSTNAVAEVDSVNAPGTYKLTLTAAEMTADNVSVQGKSSTAGVRIDGWQESTIRVPDVDPGASTGLLISGTNAGTTTLGALTVSGALTLASISATSMSIVNSNGTALLLQGSDVVNDKVGLKVRNGALFDVGTAASMNSNSGVSVNGSVDIINSNGNGVNISTNHANSHGLQIACTAGGTGFGLYVLGAGTAARFEAGADGANGAYGLHCLATAGNREGILVQGHGTAAGVQSIGGGSAGAGVLLTAGASGVALSTSGDIAVSGKLTTTGNVEISNFVVGGAITAASGVAITGDFAISGSLRANSFAVTNNITATDLALSGNLTGTAATFSGNLTASHYVGIVNDFSVTTRAEPGAVPAATATPADKLDWIGFLARNKLATTALTATTGTLAVRDNADSVDVATAAVSDDGTTAIRDKFA